MSENHHAPRQASSKNNTAAIFTISLVANIVILLLFFSPIGYKGEINFDLTIFPRIIGVLKSFTFIFLLAALIAILRKNVKLHRITKGNRESDNAKKPNL
jgi:putative membrane protein